MSLSESVKPQGFLRNRYRWLICGLLFCATAINYIDRQTLSFLKPLLEKDFDWHETDYGDIVFVFQAAYAVSYLFFGRLIDRLGARMGYAAAIGLWTLAHVGHALARSLGDFKIARIALGIGEGGNFPAGLKAVSEWFPRSERALAVGLFNAGANVGAIITPLVVPVVTLAWGWRAAFLVTGLFSVVWIGFWLKIYRRPEETPAVTAEELALIRAEPVEAPRPVPWRVLLSKREAWAYMAGRFLIDPVWWMFLFWLPDFFAKRHGLDLKNFGPPLAIVYILSDIGSVAGGYLSSALIKRGRSVNNARKIAMLISAVAVLPIVAGTVVDSLWMAVAIVGLATAAHQSFSCNLYTLPSDLFPRHAVGSVAGLGGTAGAIGGMLMAKYAGWVLESIGSYTPIFAVSASAYLLALLVIHILSPRYEPARLEE
jgi:ACS family hexuronate transporter-like MFS transporter